MPDAEPSGLYGAATADPPQQPIGYSLQSTFLEVEGVMRYLLLVLAALAVASASAHAQESKYYDLPKGDYPHDVAVGPIGEVWYAGQNLGIAGRLNPANGEIERISLGKKSAPHGVIVGPDVKGPSNTRCTRFPKAASLAPEVAL